MMFSPRARHYLLATSIAFETAFSSDPAFGGIIATVDFSGGENADVDADLSPLDQVNAGSVIPSGHFNSDSGNNAGIINTGANVTSAKSAAGAYFHIANLNSPRDVVGITGTSSDNFVLQLSFDSGIIGWPVVPTFELLWPGYFDPGSTG